MSQSTHQFDLNKPIIDIFTEIRLGEPLRIDEAKEEVAEIAFAQKDLFLRQDAIKKQKENKDFADEIIETMILDECRLYIAYTQAIESIRAEAEENEALLESVRENKILEQLQATYLEQYTLALKQATTPDDNAKKLEAAQELLEQITLKESLLTDKLIQEWGGTTWEAGLSKQVAEFVDQIDDPCAFANLTVADEHKALAAEKFAEMKSNIQMQLSEQASPETKQRILGDLYTQTQSLPNNSVIVGENAPNIPLPPPPTFSFAPQKKLFQMKDDVNQQIIIFGNVKNYLQGISDCMTDTLSSVLKVSLDFTNSAIKLPLEKLQHSIHSFHHDKDALKNLETQRESISGIVNHLQEEIRPRRSP